MTRLKSWGLLLGIAIPLLFYFRWTRLQNEKTRINLDRFAAAGDVAGIGRVLTPYFLKNKKVAVAGAVEIPAVPAKSGVKAWVLRPDGVVQVELDAKVDGKLVSLFYVPVVRVNNVIYDCLSTAPAQFVGKFCYAETLNVGGAAMESASADVAKLETLIKTQLTANQQMMEDAPAVLNASGYALPEGADTGSVVAVPSKVSDLDKCGFQCVKPQSCITPRPLACGKLVTEGNSGYFAIAATNTDHRGNSFVSLSEADKICEQQLGAGYKVLEASSISGKYQLSGDTEYWVNNRMQAEKNCWKAG
jgi:hypothetical protein